ncbi:hypothetical protein L6452_14962 [Arctium lappa]|uniref:Uncharacterized protein n=1 Tax=Arctium lappa TaxID=4217 RepID=A0ACB9CMB5_ARCLA|nr:hypothetical protein L6452_14962 [Arctium lappa]
MQIRKEIKKDLIKSFRLLAREPKFMRMRLEEREYLRGSLVETKILKEEGMVTVKRSSSYNADRTNNSDSFSDKEESTTTRTKCISRSLKASLGKQLESESMRSPIFEGPTILSERGTGSSTVSPCPCNGSRKRMIEPYQEPIRQIGVVKGARVIIHSEAPFDIKGNL